MSQRGRNRGALEHSWTFYRPDRNNPADRLERLKTFKTLRDDIDRRGFREPIELVVRPDGRRLVADGNHRAAVGCESGMAVPFVLTPPSTWLKTVTRIPGERYGTGLRGIPYQSVWQDRSEILIGRRRDTLARHELIPAEDLAGKRLLDLGCNVGSASFLAAESGASVVGVDASLKLITAAWRLAAWLGSDVDFRVADVERETLTGFEVVFCFAVAAHIRNLSSLRATLASARVVYFEENAGLESFRYVRDVFTHVDSISGGSRPMWRCEVS